jgi:hypothetical protein
MCVFKSFTVGFGFADQMQMSKWCVGFLLRIQICALERLSEVWVLGAYLRSTANSLTARMSKARNLRLPMAKLAFRSACTL